MGYKPKTIIAMAATPEDSGKINKQMRAAILLDYLKAPSFYGSFNLAQGILKFYEALQEPRKLNFKTSQD